MNCKTCESPADNTAPSLCERIAQLVNAIHSQSLKPAVRRTKMGAGASSVEVEYNDSSVEILRKRLASLLALPESKCCPCYREAMAEAGLGKLLDVRAVRVGFGARQRRECC